MIETKDIIETDDNGRVVISLSDGGLVTILPRSRVEFKNFLTAGSVRELLHIELGRVLVKIHHKAGKPNPYSVNSPAASIAVRGTEFIVDVLMGGETVVVVREGLVEVSPHNNPANKRLVTPGGKVTVRPGGDISSAFPGPGSELNGRARLNRDLQEDYQRSVDSVAQNSSEIAPVFFSAFPDLHLDSLENPAYAGGFNKAEGRLLLLPSISEPYRIDREVDPNPIDPTKETNPARFDYSISPQLTFFTPIPGSRFTIGGGVSALRTRLQELEKFQIPEIEIDHYENTVLRLSAYNYSFIAAYSFGAKGQTSAGIGIDNLSGDGSFLSDTRIKNSVSNTKYLGNSTARFGRTRLTFGLVHKFSEAKQIGIYYRHGLSSSQQTDERLRLRDGLPLGLSDLLFGKTNISTSSSELGFHWRAPLAKRLFYGVEGSYLYERINSRRENLNQPITHDRYLSRRARLGGGLGYAPISRILLNLDITGGLFNGAPPAESEPSQSEGSFSSITTLGRSTRGVFLSGYAAGQTNPWRNLFLSGSYLKTIHVDYFTARIGFLTDNGIASRAISYKSFDNSKISSGGIGWKFNNNLITEYLLSIDHNYRVPSHSIKLRYTFNLGISNEK